MRLINRRGLILVYLAFTVLTAGCVPASTTPPEAQSTQAAGTPDNALTAVPEETTEAEATQETSVNSGPLTLRVWVPPQFIPDSGTQAGALLDSRLNEFELLHPGIRITVRVKAESGPGGMVSSLAATNDAVPNARPDLILMPRLEMERAVRSRLLLPYADPLEADWYEFSRNLATENNAIYGLPFATDALVLLYRPDVILDPPKDWTTTVNTTTPLLFAGNSENALFTFALYIAAGGQLEDDNQRVFLDEATLTAVLTFYREAQNTGAFAVESSQITNENVVYQNFQEQTSDMVVTWVSNRFQNPEDMAAATGLPTVSSKPYTLANSWLWSVSNPDPSRQALATELAYFLTAPEFLAAWTKTAGYLPARADALALWADSPEASLASRIILSANALPSLDIVEKTGPALLQAVAAVLSGEADPAEAAQAAAQRINSP